MTMNLDPKLDEFARELVIHYLEGGTYEQAVDAGRKVGLPREIGEVFPGMMADASRFAAEVLAGQTEFEDAVDACIRQGALADDARGLIELAMDEIRKLVIEENDDEDSDPVTVAKCRMHRQIADEVFGQPEEFGLIGALAIAQDYIDGGSKDELVSEISEDLGEEGAALVEYACAMVDAPEGEWVEAVRRMRSFDPCGGTDG